MEPTIPPQPLPLQPVVPAPVPPKNNSLLIFILVILFLALGAAGFFAYQNYQLKQQISQVQPTPTPLITSAPTLDPTANWKTYTSATIGASMKYPATWLYTENTKSVTFETSVPSAEIQGGKTVNYSFELIQEDPVNYLQWSKDSTTKTLPTKSINGKSFERYIVADMYYSLNYIYKSNNGKIIRFMLFPYTKDEQPMNLDSTLVQILSTFTFINTKDNELADVRNFVDEYAQTYLVSDWQKLKTLLTLSAANDMTQNGTTLPATGSFTSYQIMSIDKNTNPTGYKATIRFFQNGKPYYNIPNSQSDPFIFIVKENGQWKSMSWYLYQ